MAPIINNFLFHNENATVEEQKDYIGLKISIRDSLKKPVFRKILSEILLDLQKDVGGETKKRLHHLYLELDLHVDAYKKLKSWRWQIVSQGILELTQMQVDDSYGFIKKFINDKRGIIRKQAELAIVSLRTEGIDYFLDTTRYAISEWQQLKLMEVLRHREHFRPPYFKSWLISRNHDVVLFALRLIKYYNQSDAAVAIIELVKHKDERIRAEAITCIKEFCLINALHLLKSIFWKSNIATKIEILDTISALGTEFDVNFLQKVKHKEASFLVRNKAIAAINAILPNTILPVHNLLDTTKLQEKPTAKDDHIDIAREIYDIGLKSIEVTFDEIKEIPEDHQKNDTNLPIGLTEAKLEKPSILFEIDNGTDFKNQSTKGAKDLGAKDMDFQNIYFEMGLTEKAKFIETFAHISSEEDIPTLEHIIEHEEDAELKFQVFKILKELRSETLAENHTDKETSISETQIDPEHSIFHALMMYASDIDAKHILIKEMGEVGDEKEIPLLDGLLLNNNKTIQKLAAKSKNQILQRASQAKPMVIDDENTDRTDFRPITIDTVTQQKPALDEKQFTSQVSLEQTHSDHTEDGTTTVLLPLELCFLYGELGVRSQKQEHPFLEIDFELADEFYKNQS